MERKKRLSTGATVWCWICLFANLSGFTLLIEANGRSGGGSGYPPLLVVVAVVGGVCSVGYMCLLAGKKFGFFIICGSAAACAIINIVIMAIPQAVVAFANPLITWLLIKGSWHTWDEIE